MPGSVASSFSLEPDGFSIHQVACFVKGPSPPGSLQIHEHVNYFAGI